jgi:hypothetical protein
LVLPDGTRSYIPAAWTDLQSPGALPSSLEISLVAFLPDLLRTRQRVDALLRRGGAPATASTQENQRVSKSNRALVRGAPLDAAPLLSTHAGATPTPDPSSGVSHAQAGPPQSRSQRAFHSTSNP